MTIPRLYIYAIASVGCLYLGGLAIVNKRHWLGKNAHRNEVRRKEEIVIGGVLLFLGIIGSMTSYAVFVKREPMYFLAFVFELVRWIGGNE